MGITRGNKLYKKLHVRNIAILSIIILGLTFLATLPALRVSAKVSISGLSKYEGFVGDSVKLTGQISTENGTYKIFFGDEEENGTATLYNVSHTFTVPNSTYGSYAVILQDLNTGENSTTYFTVQTNYIIEVITPPHPKQPQEGTNVTISTIVTGGNTTTFAKITVEDPANVIHTSNITIPIDQDGYGETNKIYPTDFDENPHTFYVGAYDVSLNIFNETLATESFFIGLTDATEYHRFQTVYVQAANYTSIDSLKITITYDNEPIELIPSNVSENEGITTANWTIPANASIGIYRIDVTPTDKPVPDNQTFTIFSKSFTCEVKTVNLDKKPVKGITVEANNTITSSITTNTTNEDGLAFFYLEASNYTFSAFLNNSEVSVPSEISLNETQVLNINCSLACIKIAVKDAGSNMLPFIDINATFTYITRANMSILDSASTKTNLTGIAILQNLFTNINYTIEASRYYQTFATTTINLTSTSWFNITCPTRKLIVEVLDRNGSILQDALVKIYDWGVGLSGLVGTKNTNTSGEATFDLTFGRYIAKVYKDEFLLNETSIYLINQPTNYAIYCKLYNLTLCVSVLDYFGQRIPNANITIEREGSVLSSLNTGGSGVARFTKLIGGNYKIFVYIGETQYEITPLFYLQEPKVVTLKVGSIVSIGGFIIETSYFITAVLILLVIVVFLLAFIYRRLKSRQKEE